MKTTFVSLAILLFSTSTYSLDYFISSNGSDNNIGSYESPFKTVQKGLNSAKAGDTVYLRGGVYREEVAFVKSGNLTDGAITLRNYPNEEAILDGVGLSPGNKQESMILIEDKSFITVEGLTIRNYQTSKRSVVPNAIRVEGAGESITLKSNKIHTIKTNYKKKGGNAHAISVYGTKAPEALKNIVITDNELYDLKLGSSEALVLNGNVDGFLIARNRIHHSNNIGIDIIGFEGTSPSSTYDQARNGSIIDNVVYAVATYGNPAYGKSSSAGGIYVDGGRDVLIERNIVYDSDIGIEIASEHKGRSTSKITVRNNLLYANRMTGIALGGYDAGRGKTEDCLIIGNTLYRNNTQNDGNGEIYLQYYTYRNIFKNNIMVAGPDNIMISNRDSSGNVENVFENNLYFSDDQSDLVFKWKNKNYQGLESFKTSTGQDKDSYFANPDFIDADNSNFRLSSESPAIDRGTSMGVQGGELDLDKRLRIAGQASDLGAYEYQP